MRQDMAILNDWTKLLPIVSATLCISMVSMSTGSEMMGRENRYAGEDSVGAFTDTEASFLSDRLGQCTSKNVNPEED